MRRASMIQILMILIFTFIISTLCADQANQQKMEGEFRDNTGFEGTITWWDCDDTMKELDGTFLDLQITPDTDLDVTLALVDKIFKMVLPYTGVKSVDFFPVEGDYQSFSYFQKFNGRTIARYGTIFIDIFDGDLGVYLYTLPNLKGSLNPTITAEAAYALFKKTAAPADIIPQADIPTALTYLAAPSYEDNDNQKPTDFRLAWFFKGKDKWYYFDAEDGKLLKTE